MSRNRVPFASKIKIALLSAVLVLPTLLFGLNVSSASPPDADTNQLLLVRFKPSASKAEKQALHKDSDATVMGEIEGLGVTKVKLKSGRKLSQALQHYRRSNLVEFAEEDHVRYASVAPNDPLLYLQWGISDANVETAWQTETGYTHPVKVAVLDSGIETTHEDLTTKILPGRRFHTETSGQIQDNNYEDEVGHGTSVSGIIAAATNNGKGIAGVSWGAQILPVKVLDYRGQGLDSDISAGLRWAVDQGAQVVNMSIAGDSPGETLRLAVDYARSKGVVLVASAGNLSSVNATPYTAYPAAYDGVIGVGAIDPVGQWMLLSNYGSFVDVAAPGAAIYSTDLLNEYRTKTGTSMAAAFVSGLAALIRSQDPSLTGERVSQIITEAAEDKGTAGWDSLYGNGLIDAGMALQLAGSNLPPSVRFISPVANSSATSLVTARVEVTDDRTTNVQVDFFLNGKLVASDSQPPYSQVLDVKSQYGQLTLQAVAKDTGNASGSATVKFFKQSFSDVTPSYWAYPFIEDLLARGVMRGYPNGTFLPVSNISRAEFTTALVRGLSVSSSTGVAGSFTDVKTTDWFAPYVEAAKAAGFISGYPDGTFRPQALVSRAEMAAILAKSGSYSLAEGTDFADVPLDYWAHDYIKAARNAGLINGYPDGYFRPGASSTRAEAGSVLYKRLTVSP